MTEFARLVQEYWCGRPPPPDTVDQAAHTEFQVQPKNVEEMRKITAGRSVLAGVQETIKGFVADCSGSREAVIATLTGGKSVSGNLECEILDPAGVPAMARFSIEVKMQYTRDGCPLCGTWGPGEGKPHDACMMEEEARADGATSAAPAPPPAP